jgi:hypothetical protein
MSTTVEPSIDRYVRRYQSLKPGTSSPLWHEQREEIRDAIKGEDWPWLAALADRLRIETAPAFALVRNDALFALALVRRPEALDAFFSRAASPPPWERPRDRSGRVWPRQMASLLGYGQRIEMLERAVVERGADPALREILCGWVQESVSRGEPVQQSAVLRRYWAERTLDHHPLTELPLALLDIEAGAIEASPHSEDTLGNWYHFAHHLSSALHGEVETLPDAAVTHELTLLDEARARAAGAFADSTLYPNGKWEARAFSLHERDIHEGPRSVRSLPLACLEGAQPSDVRENIVSEQTAFGALWSLFTQGGAYSEGDSAAYARLYAWRTLGALCNVPVAGPLALVRDRAARAWFTTFGAESSTWFYHVCIDVGLTCVRPEGRSMIVLAATDSD